jgi:hypothetical protein
VAGEEALAGEGSDALTIKSQVWFATVNREKSQNFKSTATA